MYIFREISAERVCRRKIALEATQAGLEMCDRSKPTLNEETAIEMREPAGVREGELALNLVSRDRVKVCLPPAG